MIKNFVTYSYVAIYKQLISFLNKFAIQSFEKCICLFLDT